MRPPACNPPNHRLTHKYLDCPVVKCKQYCQFEYIDNGCDWLRLLFLSVAVSFVVVTFHLLQKRIESARLSHQEKRSSDCFAGISPLLCDAYALRVTLLICFATRARGSRVQSLAICPYHCISTPIEGGSWHTRRCNVDWALLSRYIGASLQGSDEFRVSSIAIIPKAKPANQTSYAPVP
jgi:hypothetical protein